MIAATSRRTMMSAKALKELSRAVSHALRHEPWLYELELDDNGWVNVADLIAALRLEEGWASLTSADLEELIAQSDKQRHEMTAGRIRALYGHSLPGQLSKEASLPPDILYHGTAPVTAAQIRSEGLRPMSRQYVHLSTDLSTAEQVGGRKARRPEILVVKAGAAYRDGVKFYRGNAQVWLADLVPPAFIE